MINSTLQSCLDRLPKASEKRLALQVSPPAERALKQGHPWLFDEAIRSVSVPDAPAGDVAIVFDKNRKFLAAGLYDPTSPIRVRVFQHHKPAPFGIDMFRERLAAAHALRRQLFADGRTTGFRLVNGENDALPGVITDLYAGTAVVKLYTPAWLPHLADYLQALDETVKPERLVLRLNRELSGQAGKLCGLRDGFVSDGSDGVAEFLEHGLRFVADTVRGHKTGFFLDQRDNRAQAGKLAAGREVLNLFSYTGGFSLHAARGGAVAVESVDSSRPALEESERIFRLNLDCPAVAECRHETCCGDAFELLAAYKAAGRKFGLVIVDPPAFAKRQTEVPGALRAYRRLALASLAVVERNGYLVMASCSSRVEAEEFFALIHAAAAESGLVLAELSRGFNAPDHPVRFPEGAYLKCLYAQVKRR